MINSIKVILLFIISFSISLYYVSIKEKQLTYEINRNLKQLSDSIYRYQINVFNSEKREVADIKSKYLISFKEKNTMFPAKEIDENINALYNNIKTNPVFDNHIWTIADIYNDYMYIHPYRKEYEELITKHTPHGGYFQYLVDIENIKPDLTKTKSELYETIKVYGPYIEDNTNELLFTFYYPLYYGRSVQSILLMDIKSSFLESYIHEFNIKNLTLFKLSDDYADYISAYIYRILSQESYEKDKTLPLEYNHTYLLLSSVLLYIIFFGFAASVSYIIQYVRENKIDNLTGFYRKDHFNNNPLVHCVLVVDIDYFKNINDTYGHQMGDEVIMEVSHRIRKTIRTSDIGIRWGGEEFVIILDGNITTVDLEHRLQELLKVISDQPISNIDVTISIGAVCLAKGVILSDAFKFADEALYTSKREGRNRFTIYDEIISN